MKREGRQHGMVWTHPIIPSPWDPTPPRGHVNSFSSAPTAGLFTKVSSKPTNHSKFTGKCRRARCSDCHVHPVGKARDKAKGTLKQRTGNDAVANNRLIMWRVVDARPGLSFSRLSATGILDHLAGVDYEGDEYDDYSEEEGAHSFNLDDTHQSGLIIDSGHPSLTHIDHDDDDRMSFCDVGIVWEQEDEDGWCLLEEM